MQVAKETRERDEIDAEGEHKFVECGTAVLLLPKKKRIPVDQGQTLTTRATERSVERCSGTNHSRARAGEEMVQHQRSPVHKSLPVCKAENRDRNSDETALVMSSFQSNPIRIVIPPRSPQGRSILLTPSCSTIQRLYSNHNRPIFHQPPRVVLGLVATSFVCLHDLIFNPTRHQETGGPTSFASSKTSKPPPNPFQSRQHGHSDTWSSALGRASRPSSLA